MAWMSGSAEGGGRILALDLGDRRIGVALSDERRTIARSHAVIKRGARLEDFEKIRRIVDEEGVGLLIVGLPTLPSGKEGSRAAWARDYAADLGRHLGCQALLWDESYSTVDAEALLRETGRGSRRSRHRVDAIAAAIILQSFLDARRGAAEES
jgi:putative Holliday junction resolvase